MSKEDAIPSNNVIMEKMEKIEEKVDGLNSKLDKILAVLTKNEGKMNESNPVRLFSDFLACQVSKTIKIVNFPVLL